MNEDIIAITSFLIGSYTAIIYALHIIYKKLRIIEKNSEINKKRIYWMEKKINQIMGNHEENT